MKQLLLCVASFVFVTMGSVAHASFLLCEGDGQVSPDDPYAEWGAICAGNNVAYADIRIAPHTEWSDQIGIHVTDHGDCPGEMRMLCGYATSLEQDNECLEEQDPDWPEVGGSVSWVWVWCGCYSPDEDCHS